MSFSAHALMPPTSPFASEQCPRPTDFKIIRLILSFGLTARVSSVVREERTEDCSALKQIVTFGKIPQPCCYSFPTGVSLTCRTEGMTTELSSSLTKIRSGLLRSIHCNAMFHFTFQKAFLSSLFSPSTPRQLLIPACYSLQCV